MTPRARTIPAVVLALVLGACPAAGAASPTETLRDFFAGVNRVLTDRETDGQPLARLLAIRKLVSDVVDVREAATRALGREWAARTATEQDEFVGLFATLLEQAHVLRVATKADVNAGVTIRYLGESVEADTATVLTALRAKDGGDVFLEYRMSRRGERWMVHDVVMDGVSLVANYRAQLRRVIRASSYPDLVAQMKAQVAQSLLVTAAAAVAEPVPARAPDAEIEPVRAAAESRIEAARGAAPPETVDRHRATAVLPRERLAAAIGSPAAAPASPSPTASGATLPAMPAPATTPSYWVQVGAFRSPDAAGRLADRLRERNLVLSERWLSDTTGGREEALVRVRIGPFTDRATALAKLRELRAKGYQPFVLAARD